MTTIVFADLEGAMRTYLRAQLASVSGRVYFQEPVGDRPAYPYVLMSGRGVDHARTNSEAPFDFPVMQFTIIAGKRDMPTAKTVMLELRSIFQNIDTPTVLSTGVTCLGVHVTAAPFVPDPESGEARYLVTAQVTGIAA